MRSCSCWPARIALTSDGTRAYVTNLLLDTVSVIDTFPLRISAEIPVGLAPVGIAITPDETRVYVTNNNGGSVSVIDTSINIVITTIPVAFRPSGIAFTFGPIDIEDLTDAVRDLVTAGILNQGQGNSLISKLEVAREELDKGNDIAAMNLLLAFINQVQAFVNTGRLTEFEGQPLIDAANAIVAQILAGG